jgi:predicted DsbA family dithiol-disulfide isomerase
MSEKEKSLEKTVEKDIKIAEKKLHKINVWMITSIVLIIVLVGVLAMSFAGSGSDKQVVADKAVKFINDNLVQPGTNASFVSVSEFAGLYNITVSYQGRDISVFLTKTGNDMFLSSPLNITQNLPKQETAEETPTEPVKTDKPTVQLYVMAFCPYGIQAETAMKPVVDLLGTKANIEIHYIANVAGTTPDSVTSLHGAVEAQEDLRQVCADKYYDQKTVWNYVNTINSNCSSSYRDASYDACWKNVAAKAGMDVTKIEACSSGSEGVNLLKADGALTTQYGITGSPTLLINGVKSNPARTAEGYKTAICASFNTAPAECSTQLSSTSTTATGSC